MLVGLSAVDQLRVTCDSCDRMIVRACSTISIEAFPMWLDLIRIWDSINYKLVYRTHDLSNYCWQTGKFHLDPNFKQVIEALSVVVVSQSCNLRE